MTKSKTILTALVLALAPSIGLAKCFYPDTTIADLCALGQSWDAVTAACVATVG